jgi:tRNA threonylcarbamoyladenosine biosynthesis protein TsaB
MKFAAIETATEWCSVALWIEGEIVSLERRAGNRQGEFVLPMLDQLFSRTRTSREDLDAIAFGAGPGAFTGLRIACGIAQGLAFGRGLPVIGISTLEATAEESGATRAVAALDARMHEVYYAAFEKRADKWTAVLPATCVAPDEVDLPPGEGWVGCGSGFAVYAERIRPRLKGVLARIAPDVRPSAHAVAKLAAPRLEAGEGVDAAEAAPHYIRDKVALTTSEQGKKK